MSYMKRAKRFTKASNGKKVQLLKLERAIRK